MRWTKLGVLIEPDPNVWWMTHYAGPSFVRCSGAEWIIYVTGRDSENVSRIGRVRGQVVGESVVAQEVDRDPVFDIGEVGTFDESGVSYPWIIEVGNRLLMYYVGWVAGGRSRFQNFTGLAVSSDDGRTWDRMSAVPLLDRSDDEPFGTGSCCVIAEPEGYLMVYTSFHPWVSAPGKNRPTYNLKKAFSRDGLHWTRTGDVVVDFASESEYVIGKPCLVESEGVRHLWYSFRGPAYRIGYSRENLQGAFVRRDDLAGISVSHDGWDSESIEYAQVFESQGHFWMIYNGNDFGRTGLGLARLAGGLLDD